MECIACQTNLVTGRNCRSPWVLGNFFTLHRIIKSIPTGRWRGIGCDGGLGPPILRFRGGEESWWVGLSIIFPHPHTLYPGKAFRVGDRQTLMDRVDGQTAAMVCVRLFLSKTQLEGRIPSEEQYPCRV